MKHFSFLQTIRAIPKQIWILGISTFLVNISSVITFSFSPLYLTVVFGVTAMGIGSLEGIVESLSYFMRIFSGILSDWLRKRKLLIVLGYFFVALSRLIYPLAQAATWIFAGRIVERLSYGLQVAPREAFVADVAPAHLRGACYGLRQAFGMVGSVVGGVLGIWVMEMSHTNYRLLFTLAIIPSFLALFLLIFLLKEPKELAKEKKDVTTHLSLASFSSFSPSFWIFMGVIAIFMLGRYSEVFMILWVKDLGLSEKYAPVVLVLINVASSISSYPIGALSDRLDRRFLLAAGLVLLLMADIFLALANSYIVALWGIVFWGLHYGVSYGLVLAMVSDRCPKELRGTTFGILFVVMGIMLLLANHLSGWLTIAFGAPAAFWLSAVLMILALGSMWFLKPYRVPGRPLANP